METRQTFMTRVRIAMSEPDVALVELAYLLAKKFHKGQFRKEIGPDGKPLRYFEHVRRVAISLLERGVSDPSLICAALLHDFIEDSEEQQLAAMLLQRTFPELPLIFKAVQILTKVPSAGYIDRLQEATSTAFGSSVILIKMADRLDNLSTLPKDNQAFCDKQILESRVKMIPVFLAAKANLESRYSSAYSSMYEEIFSILYPKV